MRAKPFYLTMCASTDRQVDRQRDRVIPVYPPNIVVGVYYRPTDPYFFAMLAETQHYLFLASFSDDFSCWQKYMKQARGSRGPPCWAIYLKYKRNSRKHPTKLEILKTYLSTLINDTVPISIKQIYEKVRGPCMALLYSTDVYMSCKLVSFTSWPGLSSSTKRPAMSALGQKSRVDYTLNTVIGLSSSAFEIKITD